MRAKLCRALILMSLSAGVLPLSQALATELKVETFVERRVIATDANGAVSASFETADLVKPGEYLRYSLRYSNALEGPAEAMVLTFPVPAEVEYVFGSAESEGQVHLVSIDGGARFFAPTEDLLVERPRVTHIRWVFSDPVLSGQTGVVSMGAILK